MTFLAFIGILALIALVIFVIRKINKLSHERKVMRNYLSEQAKALFENDKENAEYALRQKKKEQKQSSMYEES